jgi:hypothetical protein
LCATCWEKISKEQKQEKKFGQKKEKIAKEKRRDKK